MNKLRRMFFVFVILVMGKESLAESPWSEIKTRLKVYQPTAVHESEYSYGGMAIRLFDANIENEEQSILFSSTLEEVQKEIPLRELHLLHFEGKALSSFSFIKATPKLRLLSLGGANYPKTELRKLKELKSLEALFISGDGWDKEAFVALGEAQSITELGGQCLKSENWDNFPRLENLVEIDLGNSNFDDAGASALTKCLKISRIHAYETQLTDAGLMEVAKLENLSFIGITLPGDGDSTVTEKGLEAFRKARPKVEVRTNRPKTPHPPKAPAPFLPGQPGSVT